MAIAGRIEYEITVDNSGLTKGLNDAKKQTSNFASTVGGMAKTAGKALGATVVAGAVASAAAITKLAGSAVTAYADFEQLKGGVETLFKDSADAVIENANRAYMTAGLSANEYMEQATSFSASLLQSLSGDTAEASRITDMAIQDMADNMNKMGSSMESIQHAYQGFAKQNYTMLDNLKLGYGGTKGEMERLLADAEKLTGVSYDISNLDDVFNAIHAIQVEMGITGTTAEEAMKTITGSANMLKSAWKNLMAGIADDNADFDKLIDNLVESFTAFTSNFVPRLGIAIKGAVKALGAIVPELIKVIPDLLQELLPAIMEATTMLISALVENFPTIMQTIMDALPMIMDALFQILQGIIDNLPMLIDFITRFVLGLVTLLLAPENLNALLKAGLQLLIQIVNAIPDFLVALIDALPEIIASIVAFMTDPMNLLMIIDAGVQLFMGLVQAIPKILNALIKAFGELFGKLWENLQTMFKNFAGNFGEAIGNIFKHAINGVLSFIEGFINAPINVVNSFVDAINTVLQPIGGHIDKLSNIKLPRMASGGIVEARNGGQLILAGEAGQDEWVVPESKMADMIQKINEQGGTGGGITINIQGVFATSDAEQRAVAEQIYDKLQEINKTRMGAYL